MKYEFKASDPILKEIRSLQKGDFFVKDGYDTVFMVTDEKVDENRRCVSLRTGAIFYFNNAQKVRSVVLIEPPVFGLA